MQSETGTVDYEIIKEFIVNKLISYKSTEKEYCICAAERLDKSYYQSDQLSPEKRVIDNGYAKLCELVISNHLKSWGCSDPDFEKHDVSSWKPDLTCLGFNIHVKSWRSVGWNNKNPYGIGFTFQYDEKTLRIDNLFRLAKPNDLVFCCAVNPIKRVIVTVDVNRFIDIQENIKYTKGKDAPNLEGKKKFYHPNVDERIEQIMDTS